MHHGALPLPTRRTTGDRHTRRFAWDRRAIRLVPPALTLLLLAAVGVAYLVSPQVRAGLQAVAGVLLRGDVAAVRDYLLAFGPWGPVISTALMVLTALIPPLPAFLIAFANGLAYGTLWGGVLSVAAMTLQTSLAFGLARALGRGPMEALLGQAQVATADRWFARWGALAVLLARLIPFVSLDLVSYGSGLTRVRFWQYLLATLVGIIPSTVLYAYLGERAARYAVVLLALNALVLLGGIVATLIRRRNRGAGAGNRGLMAATAPGSGWWPPAS